MKVLQLIPVLIVFNLICPNDGSAQFETYGLKGGAQSAGVYTDLPVDKRAFGYSIYGFADYRFTHHFSTTLELGVTRRGFANTQKEMSASGEVIQTVEANSRMMYLSFAPFLNVEFPAKGLIPYLGVAPRMDYLIERTAGTYDFTEASVTDPMVTHFNEEVFGAALAAGIKRVSIEPVKLRLEVKYEVDVSDSYSEYPTEIRNNSVMALIGVGF